MVGELPAPPSWDDAPMCTASKTDPAGQGPFFIHNLEKDDDVDLFRQDIRGKYHDDAPDGIEMHLYLRILDSTSTDCNGTPLKDVEVYIWNTDAQGFYSGFGTPGGQDEQKPDQPYSGVPSSMNLENTMRFCRGAQVTDEAGVVAFRTIFPGWYNGRDVHIHFVAFKPGSMSKGRVDYHGDGHLFTTQFYFERDFTDMVHKSQEPYLARTMLDAYEGAIDVSSPDNSGLRAKATFENKIVTAQMQILLDPAGD
jgi:protocatechuate 3,4-dioxygenase beta subunit